MPDRRVARKTLPYRSARFYCSPLCSRSLAGGVHAADAVAFSVAAQSLVILMGAVVVVVAGLMAATSRLRERRAVPLPA